MAGVSTPELAAAVSNAGALGSIGVGATNASGAARMIDDVRRLTEAAFNVNVFIHNAPRRDADREASWLTALGPVFEEFDAAPPSSLKTIYKSFADDEDMLRLLVERAPPVVSFHFGLPEKSLLDRVKATGAKIISSATTVDSGEGGAPC